MLCTLAVWTNLDWAEWVILPFSSVFCVNKDWPSLGIKVLLALNPKWERGLLSLWPGRKGGFCLLLALRRSFLCAPWCPCPCRFDMTCCGSMLWTGQRNPFSCWGRQRFFIDKLRCRWCHEETRLLSFCCFCLCLCLSLFSVCDYFWDLLDSSSYKKKDRDLEDIIILPVVKMSNWLWERLYKMSSTSILGSRESTGAAGGMKRTILWESKQLEKLWLKPSLSWVLQNATQAR